MLKAVRRQLFVSQPPVHVRACTTMVVRIWTVITLILRAAVKWDIKIAKCPNRTPDSHIGAHIKDQLVVGHSADVKPNNGYHRAGVCQLIKSLLYARSKGHSASVMPEIYEYGTVECR